MGERRIYAASTTSSALAEGALAPAEIAAPSPNPRPSPDAQRRKRLLRRIVRMRKWKLILLVLLLLVSLAGGVVYFGPATLGTLRPLQNAVLLDSSGKTVIAELRPEQNRVWVSLEEIPDVVSRAFIAAEDERFWSHLGVDPVAILRAVFANARGDREGASTITQQYVRNSEALGIGAERTLSRKVREAVTAIRIDRRYSKEDILERYLNSIYLGNGAYGVQAASRLYFGRDVQHATLEQAALLAGVTASPTRFDPRKYPERARVRRDYVLGRMLELKMIGADEEAAAKAQPVDIAPRVPQTAIAPVFVDFVRGQLMEEFGEDTLYRGGLKVKTTIDLEIQQEVEDAVAEILDRPDDPEAAVVVLDSATGSVRAMYGGRNKRLGDLNLATQGPRQAGSAFKPFVLAAALDQGKTLEDRYNAPGSMRLRLPTGEVWKVRNYDGRGRGRITMERALAYSVNTVYAQMIRDVEPSNVAAIAKRSGVQSRLRPVHSLALGTSEVTALDLATGYATFDREGVYLKSSGLAAVENAAGKRLYRNEEPGQRKGVQRLDPDVANDVVAAMKTVVRVGTGRVARMKNAIAWAKTGTTEDHADAWFCGGAGGVVACVWVGHPEGRVPMLKVHGIRVVGSSFPAQIWKRAVEATLEKYPPSGNDDLPQKRPQPSATASPSLDDEIPEPEPSEDPGNEPTPRQSTCVGTICLGGGNAPPPGDPTPEPSLDGGEPPPPR